MFVVTLNRRTINSFMMMMMMVLTSKWFGGCELAWKLRTVVNHNRPILSKQGGENSLD